MFILVTIGTQNVTKHEDLLRLRLLNPRMGFVFSTPSLPPVASQILSWKNARIERSVTATTMGYCAGRICKH